MKVLIFGGNGMLGHKLVQRLSDRFEVVSTVRRDFADVEGFGLFQSANVIKNVSATEVKSFAKAVRTAKPDVVINAIGIIKQVPSSKEVIQTLEVNSIFPHRLAELSGQEGFRLINISTDCVFSGEKGNYSEDDTPDAADLYGRSKQLGEVGGEHCLTLRTSIIGRELGSVHSLIEWFLSNKGNRVDGFVNAIYSGFPTIVFADIISLLISDFPGLDGLYHLSSEPINKYDLLSLVKKRIGLDIEIERFEDFHIDRSLNSQKFKTIVGYEPPTWPDMIDQMFSDPTPYDRWKVKSR